MASQSGNTATDWTKFKEKRTAAFDKLFGKDEWPSLRSIPNRTAEAGLLLQNNALINTAGQLKDAASHLRSYIGAFPNRSIRFWTHHFNFADTLETAANILTNIAAARKQRKIIEREKKNERGDTLGNKKNGVLSDGQDPCAVRELPNSVPAPQILADTGDEETSIDEVDFDIFLRGVLALVVEMVDVWQNVVLEKASITTGAAGNYELVVR